MNHQQHRSIRRILSAMLVFGGLAATANAADLKGKFVLDGDAPAPVQVADPKAGSEFPGATIFYDNMVVDPTTKGIANIAVWVRSDMVQVTPEAEKAIAAEVEIDNKTGKFHPHIVGLWPSKQKLFFRNSDPVAHNSNFPHAGVNPLLPAGSRQEIPVAGTKLLPQELSCNIHPWMKAFIVLREHPYVAVTGADGSFVIKNLPEGVELEFQVWHEKSGYVVVNDWEKGRFMKTLGPGETDLGEIKVPAELFNKQ